ncbi:DMP19 family protein [Pedobacter ginsengisoli]|uniref:DMP19 family protein n=1 Tax=Pedobacter ginsengisoli TaxID=363852 RepID=UPI002550194B|nr:DUF4375 domain-containing protein [Pedobacter ginsengisoli]
MFKNPFSFNGRIRWLEYGLSNLIFFVPYILIGPYIESGTAMEQAVMLILYIPLSWFIFAQGAKRCHDKGVNGWWQLLPFYSLVLLFYRGDEGANEYGPDPKGKYAQVEGEIKEPELITPSEKPPFHMKNLSQLLDAEDQNGSVIEIDNFINSCQYGENFERLSVPQKNFLFNQNLEREVNNGGFWQFFVNSSGEYAHETVHSLQEIGAIKTADIVQKAIDRFPVSKVPKDWAERNKLVEDIDPEKELWGDLDKEFFEYQEDLNALNMGFVAKHKDSF